MRLLGLFAFHAAGFLAAAEPLPDLLAAAKTDFQKRTKDRRYTTLVPKGQKAPVRIR